MQGGAGPPFRNPPSPPVQGGAGPPFRNPPSVWDIGGTFGASLRGCLWCLRRWDHGLIRSGQALACLAPLCLSSFGMSFSDRAAVRGRASRGVAAGAHLRVVGGDAGGRRLHAPRGIRPTQSLVREAIFDVLREVVPGAVVLDLFAGSGALGIEALSRGAASAVFVDRDLEAVRAIGRNLESLNMAARGRVVRGDVTRWLPQHAEDVRAASLVLVDPPYNDPVLEQSLALLDALAVAGTTIVVEHPHRRPLPTLDRLRADRARRYGDTSVSVLSAS